MQHIICSPKRHAKYADEKYFNGKSRFQVNCLTISTFKIACTLNRSQYSWYKTGESFQGHSCTLKNVLIDGF